MLDDAPTMGEVYPSPSTALGTIAKFASTPKNSGLRDTALLERFRLQNVARHLLPGHAVGSCLRQIRPTFDYVEVHVNEAERFAKYRNLMVCGRVWVCPVCASTISETRRKELAAGVTFASGRGHTVLLETLTFSHHRGDSLPLILDQADKARKAMLSGRAASVLAAQFGYIGRITAQEITYTRRNGWHPHWHSLVILRHGFDASAYERWARARWEHVTRRAGLTINDHGYDLKATYGAIADYVTKYGHAPEKEPWGPEAEMTKSHIKRGRITASMTPFQLLDAAEYSGEAASLFQHYAPAMKGRRQLRWSPGLRAYLHVDEEERTDEEIAQGGGDLPTRLAGLIYRDHWEVIKANDARGELLAAARAGGWDGAVAFMRNLGVNVS